jgi:hypothetical protein
MFEFIGDFLKFISYSLLALFLCAIVVGVIWRWRRASKMATNREKLRQRDNFRADLQVFDKHLKSISIDERRRLLCLGDSKGDGRLLPFSSLLSIDIEKKESSVVRTTYKKRDLVDRALSLDPTSKGIETKQVDTALLKLTLQDMRMPLFVLEFHGNDIGVAQEWLARLTAARELAITAAH